MTDDRPATAPVAGDAGSARTPAGKLLSLSPLLASFTVYSVLLDHLPESWFTQDWLRYVLAIALALIVGVVLWALIDRHTAQAAVATPGPATARPVPAAPAGPSVAELMTAARAGLLARYRAETRADGVELVGWAHHLDSTRGPSPIGTAYGARILALLDVTDSRVDRDRMLATLLAMQRDGGGWSARSQRGVSRPEATAWVLGGAVTLGLDAATRATLVARLEGLLDPHADEAGMARTSVLTTALTCLARVAPSSPMTSVLATTLVRGAIVAQEHGRSHAYWRRTVDLDGSASPAHTARAVLALSHARRVLPDSPLREQLTARIDAGLAWLATQQRLEIFTEALDRPSGQDTDLVHIGHFTPAWVARALMLAGPRYAESDTMRAAIADVLRCRREDNGLWQLPKDTTQPIWMTYQALVTLQQHACLTTRPVAIGPAP